MYGIELEFRSVGFRIREENRTTRRKTNNKLYLHMTASPGSEPIVGNNYLQTHGTAIGTKMAVAFANIFMAVIETKMISQSQKKIDWKRFIDDIFSQWGSDKKEINLFLNKLTIKFTAEISENETSFLDTIIFKGERFSNESILMN